MSENKEEIVKAKGFGTDPGWGITRPKTEILQSQRTGLWMVIADLKGKIRYVCASNSQEGAEALAQHFRTDCGQYSPHEIKRLKVMDQLFEPYHYFDTNSEEEVREFFTHVAETALYAKNYKRSRR